MTESARLRLLELSQDNAFKKYIDQYQSIVKVQALWRGYMVRKRLAEIHDVMDGTDIGEFDEALTMDDLLANERVREVYERHGPYKIPDFEIESVLVVDKCAFQVQGGIIYIGQWERDLSKKAGKGRQSWSDGSLYEGQWVNGKANGLGRMIHSDGDVYEGQWRDDKANGDGRYLHFDGAIYEGQWKDDKQHGNGVEVWPD